MRRVMVAAGLLSLVVAGCEGVVSRTDVDAPTTGDAGANPPFATDAGSTTSHDDDASLPQMTDSGMTCATGAADCDQDSTNGCETVLTESTDHCGACNRPCTSGEACSDGTCVAPTTSGETHSFSGGLAHACALADAGDVWCWGWGTRGQLGNGSNQSSDSPVRVRDLTGIVDLQARDNTTCARNAAGSLWCWGQNENGEAGDGSGNNRNVPSLLDLSPVVAFGVGLDHACAVTGEGIATCWGDSGSGQLGTGANGRDPSPIQGLTDVVTIDAGNEHTCAVNGSGQLYCWGDNGFGQLGDGGTTGHRDPGDPVDLGSPVKEIALGRRTSCARVETGSVYCWGANHYGEVGNGSSADEVHDPVEVQGLDGLDVVDINCGGHFACALGRSGELRCWGDSRAGQQGRETRAIRTAEPVSTIGTVDAFEGGGHHLCVGAGGEVHCLGKDDQGQMLGSGDRTTPITIPL